MGTNRHPGALVLAVALVACLGPTAWAASGCARCHAEEAEPDGFLLHGGVRVACVACHGGDAAARDQGAAHRGLIPFPGNLDNAGSTCGRCHAREVRGVREGSMHRGAGMVSATRRVLGEAGGEDLAAATLQTLGHGPADSLLRKLCAGCHLGLPRTEHAVDVVHDRGGGCLACHVQSHPPSGHPRLTMRVEDGRCFGCHSRSGRISLSYVGLAEVGEAALNTAADRLLRLADGRLLERRAEDVHHRAGMGCVDCHTIRDVMGAVLEDGTSAGCGPVDVACRDCHAQAPRTVPLREWPARMAPFRSRVPFEVEEETPFVVTGCGTPLWNLELRGAQRWLHPKRGGSPLPVPVMSSARPGHDPSEVHARLSCEACHAQWAPRCHGCHLEYDPRQTQWDHVEGRETPGRWRERRWDIDNGPPALGVTAEGRIGTFVPGMILTVEHPDWASPRFRRLYARLSPHTIGAARTCRGCHRDPYVLGLGRGRLLSAGGGWRFEPASPPGPDGLPADAWTGLDRAEPGESPRPGDRSFTRRELLRILTVPLGADAGDRAPPGD
jgi:hypothetical protein